MRKYLIDTNVVLDLLLDREPYADAASAVFDAMISGNVMFGICSLSFSNIFYVMRPRYGKERTLEGLRNLALVLTILPVNEKVIADALASDFSDFEDAIQYYSALDNDVHDGIITRNAKDFRSSRIPVMSPEDFLLEQ